MRSRIQADEVSPPGPAFDAVCELFDDYRAHYGERRSPAEVSAWLDAPCAAGRMRVVAAAVDCVPRGFVTTTAAPASLALGTAWLIRDLWVDPAHRRRGLARRLVEEAIGAGRSAGARRIGLQTEVDNAPALALYQELGFRRVTGLEVLGLDLEERADPA